jgi:hypothetical protein
VKIPRELCDELHGLTRTDWGELAESDKADLTNDQRDSLYYFYTREETREWISQKLGYNRNKITRLNRDGMNKIIRYYARQKRFSANIMYALPMVILLFMYLFSIFYGDL